MSNTSCETSCDRRSFLRHGAGALAVGAVLSQAQGEEAGRAADAPPGKRVKVAVIGCGSVSTHYLPKLTASPHVELLSTCDRIFDRAKAAAAKHRVPNAYPHMEKLLAGAKFDLLVNLTDMQEHEHLNREAIAAGKHVWSEKPIANSLEAGEELLALAKRAGVRVWGSPTVVNSPQFRFMAQTLAAGTLGRVSAAHASYGHLGPGWSAFFYEKGGGSMPDLGVYNFTTLTGLLGPAKSVTAMTSIVTPRREVEDKGEIDVTAEDNAMVLMDHGHGVISHTQCGFNYFAAREQDAARKDLHTITIHGTHGSMARLGPARRRPGDEDAAKFPASCDGRGGLHVGRGRVARRPLPGRRRRAAVPPGARAARRRDHHRRPRLAGDRPAGADPLDVPVAGVWVKID
jgi:predicted dehydrogenase